MGIDTHRLAPEQASKAWDRSVGPAAVVAEGVAEEEVVVGAVAEVVKLR
jgi:hypothetical protein